MPRKPYTEAEKVRSVCNAIFSAWNFEYHRRMEWIIWGARHRTCPKCKRQPYTPCAHLGDIYNNKEVIRDNKTPHAERMDWQRILDGLKKRGYYRALIERQIRKQMEDEA